MSTVITSVKEEERRQRKVVLLLLAVAILGVGIAAFDEYRRMTILKVPSDISMLDGVLDAWSRSGFVRSLYVPTSLLVVDDAQWTALRAKEKKKVVVEFARYCAQHNNSGSWTLKVKLANSGSIVGEMGAGRLLVN